MFRYFGALSDVEFLKRLGNGIYIWPFKEAKLKGSTYNLTASKIAFYRNYQGENISVVDEDDVIHFPAQKTVLIQTEESIFVEKNYCGTYHTKVSLVSKGLSSISTTLDPCYFGTSLIAITNLSSKAIKLNVGETFCSLMIYKMKPASKEKHDNLPFRADVAQYEISTFELYKNKDQENKDYDRKIKRIKKDYKEWYKQEFRTNRASLIETVKNFKANLLKKELYYRQLGLFIVLLTLLCFFIVDKIIKANIDKEILTYITTLTAPIMIFLFAVFDKFIKK